MTLPKETQDKIKADAENYAGVMVWINKHPKGEEQLFYEYISATSHIAGATEWAGKVQELVDAMEIISKAPMPTNAHERESWVSAARATVVTALAKYKEVSNGS